MRGGTFPLDGQGIDEEVMTGKWSVRVVLSQAYVVPGGIEIAKVLACRSSFYCNCFETNHCVKVISSLISLCNSYTLMFINITVRICTFYLDSGPTVAPNMLG